MAYDINLEGKNKLEAHQLLKDTSKVLDSCNIDYWLDGGTLLGIHRENRLLPWDDDVDLSIMYTGEESMNKLLKSLKKSKLRIRPKTFQQTCEHFVKDKVRVIKIRNNKLLGISKGKVCLEIFIRYPHGKDTYCGIGPIKQVIPIKLCDSFKKINFEGDDFNAPKLTNEYLTHKYGDWKTPVKEWSVFSDDKANI
ncbi:LicD family protein [Bacteroidota bacterium]